MEMWSLPGELQVQEDRYVVKIDTWLDPSVLFDEEQSPEMNEVGGLLEKNDEDESVRVSEQALVGYDGTRQVQKDHLVVNIESLLEPSLLFDEEQSPEMYEVGELLEKNEKDDAVRVSEKDLAGCDGTLQVEFDVEEFLNEMMISDLEEYANNNIWNQVEEEDNKVNVNGGLLVSEPPPSQMVGEDDNQEDNNGGLLIVSDLDVADYELPYEMVVRSVDEYNNNNQQVEAALQPIGATTTELIEHGQEYYYNFNAQDQLQDTAFPPLPPPELAAHNHGMENKKTCRWTEDEHILFLIGLKTYGHDWVQVSINSVPTKTPEQIASHNQKYELRQKKRSCPDTDTATAGTKRRSIHDITIDDLDRAEATISTMHHNIQF